MKIYPKYKALNKTDCTHDLLYFLYLTGLEAIRYGCQTVDPVTGILATVVGARLDISRKTVVPLTASYWLTMAERTDSVQVGVYF